MSNEESQREDHETPSEFAERVSLEVYLPAAIAMGATAVATFLMKDYEAALTGLATFVGINRVLVKLDICDHRS